MDTEGCYRFRAPEGKYALVVSAMGYEPVEQEIHLKRGARRVLDFALRPEHRQLNEVVVTASGVGRVKRSAYNAVAVDATELHNSAKTLGDALAKAPGVKLRESGGVGSDMQLMLDGFSGRHVKVFIDGVPQEGGRAGIGPEQPPRELRRAYRGLQGSGARRLRHGCPGRRGQHRHRQAARGMAPGCFVQLRLVQHA